MHPPRWLGALVCLAVALAGAPAAAKGARLNVPLVDTPLEACPGDAIEPDEIIEGQLPGELMNVNRACVAEQANLHCRPTFRVFRVPQPRLDRQPRRGGFGNSTPISGVSTHPLRPKDPERGWLGAPL